MEKVYYEELEFLQFDYETAEFEELLEKTDDRAMLRLASEYDNTNGMNEKEMHKRPNRFPGDSVISENDKYVLVRNVRSGGTWAICKKWKAEDVIKELSELENYANCSKDMNNLIGEVLAQWRPE